MFNLGVMYAKGHGAERDDKAAADLYLGAAEKGLATAQFALANSFAKGEGVARDPAAAAKWSKRAADQGHEKAALMYQALQSSGTESRPQPDPVAEKASSGSGSGIEEYPA